MNTSKKYLIVSIATLVFILLMSSCRVNKTTTTKGEFKKVAEIKLPPKIDYIYNADKTYVLCVGGRSSLSTTFSFFVYSLENNKMATEVFTNVQTVKWKNSKSINYKFRKGIVKKNELSQPYITLTLK
jgi:hypothetical protein